MPKKYVIRSPRYMWGKYINASPHEPQVIELPDDIKPGHGMVPYEDGPLPPAEKLKPHYSDAAKPTGQTSADVQSRPLQDKEPVKPKSRRTSDSDV